MGEVVDIHELARQAKAARAVEEQVLQKAAKEPLAFARGVDLLKVKNKKHHQHLWILCFSVPVEREAVAKAQASQVQAQDIARQIAARVDSGALSEEEGQAVLTHRLQSEIEQAPLPIDFNTALQDGPGCAKCGAHAMSEQGKQLCEVSDEGFNFTVPTPPPGSPAVVQQGLAFEAMREAQKAAGADEYGQPRDAGGDEA